MSEYRDYGTIESAGLVNVPVDTERRTQVFWATHNGEGQSLPYMHRSFISFTYGGRKIEEFNLISIIDGDRMNRGAYAPFNDTVTTYDNLDGQHYWATHYQAHQLDFTLSTDGIDQKMLDDFKHWFKAGTTRELILAEHPNRAIMARVSQPPTINLLPFEQEVEITIFSNKYKTKTTLYKGDISLSLVMDSPHWYSIVNILGKKDTITDGTGTHERYINIWDDITTGEEIEIFASQDALKILYEDGIPLGSMIRKNMLLGNGAYANVEEQTNSQIWSLSEEEIVWSGGSWGSGTPSGEGAQIEDKNDVLGIGAIAGAIVNADGDGITTLSANINGYFYYAGTAPAPTVISFSMVPQFSGYYISTPKNSYSAGKNENKYNTLTIESLTKQELKFTTPNLFTSYNKAQKIFETYVNSNTTWEQVREMLRGSVQHPKVREFAIKALTVAKGNSNSTNIGVNASVIQTYMKKFLVGNGNLAQPVTFTFNSKTGQAIGSFSYYDDNMNLIENQEEDVGDMLRSNYIIIQDRNYPTSDGIIEGWSDANTTTKQYSHRIFHDVTGGLNNIKILYKNMYL